MHVHIEHRLVGLFEIGAVANRQVEAAVQIEVGEVQQAEGPEQPTVVLTIAVHRHIRGGSLELLEGFEGVLVAHGDEGGHQLIGVVRCLGEQHLDQVLVTAVDHRK
ncbi:hypothetical protein [Pseudomonas pergaminensis]